MQICLPELNETNIMAKDNGKIEVVKNLNLNDKDFAAQVSFLQSKAGEVVSQEFVDKFQKSTLKR